jgi:hypothetical protein
MYRISVGARSLNSDPHQESETRLNKFYWQVRLEFELFLSSDIADCYVSPSTSTLVENEQVAVISICIECCIILAVRFLLGTQQLSWSINNVNCCSWISSLMLCLQLI